MNFKAVVLILILGFLFFVNLNAKIVAEFEEFGKPEGFYITDSYIYVQEKVNIYIYNLKDFKFVKKFGNEGEGPGELKISPFGAPLVVTPYKEKLYISSTAKLSIFSKTGDFIKEFKVNAMGSYYPFGDAFVCLTAAPSDKDKEIQVLAYFLADKSFNKGKILYKSDVEMGQNAKMSFPIARFYGILEEDQMFIIAGKEGFAIDCFNTKGEKQYRIKKDFPNLKVPSDYHDETHKWFKTASNFKQFYDFFKTRISFKKYYPPIFSVNIHKRKMYVLTSRLKKNLRECVVMDMKGKEIKKTYLPVEELYGYDFRFHFTFHDGYFYKLVENIDEETWELLRIEI